MRPVFLEEYRTIDKKTWPAGAWNDEPDKVHWIDKKTGLDCLMVRNNRGGHWCGYVGVTEGHPAFGLDYDAASALGPERDGYRSLDVHGGLTYANFCQESDDFNVEAEGICHTPAEGRPEKVWWLGFDCAHLGDLCPGDTLLNSLPRYGSLSNTYRTLEYVVEECASLAAQLAALVPARGAGACG